MFPEFSERMYEKASAEGFKLAASGASEIASSSHWAAQRVEMATLVNLHVIDANLMNWNLLVSYDVKVRAAGEAMLKQASQVASIYILAGGAVPDWNGAEEYYGQPVYSVFWHVDLGTGEITAPKGQPKKLFNLRNMIEAARKEAVSGESHGGVTFASVDHKHALRHSPKHRHGYITYAVLLINAVILGLMYWQGYPQDMLVPLRFGAIYPPLILNNGEWYRLFTAMFIHFGVTHFAANAFGLLIFGTRVERYFGRGMFLAVYILAGLLGSVFSLFFSQAYAAGASGAIYGLVGAMFAYTRITKRSIEFISWYVMLIYIGVGGAMGLATPGVDNFAHLGGLIGGVVIGGLYAFLKKK